MIFSRTLVVLAVLVLVSAALAASGAGSAHASHAPGSTVFVDDDCTNPGDGSAGNPFCTVQDGIAHANAGDTVDVAAGLYVESGQIVIDQDLTIQGAGIGVTELRTDTDTSSRRDDGRGWILVEPGIEFHISDLTLNGEGHRVWQAIRHLGTGTVEHVHFTNIKYQESGQPYAGTGIAAFGSGDSPVHVTGSMFDEIGRIGIHYFGPGVNGSIADDNGYVGKGPGDWLDYGIEVGGGAQIVATNNDIQSNRGVARSDGSTSAGILVTSFFGGGSEAIIESNDLTENSTAIFVGFGEDDTSDVTANLNNISGNDSGIRTTAPIVEATCNWWGGASGPFNATTNPGGTGDSVDDDVVFNPWLTSEAPGGDCNGFLDPATVDDCKNGGWEFYGFENQGLCIRFVQTGQDSRE